MIADAPANPFIASWLSDPENMAGAQEFMPKGMKAPSARSTEKQKAEFDILLKTPPTDNPQYLQLSQMVEKLTPIVQAGIAEQQQMQVQGIQMPPDLAQKLQQAQQLSLIHI